MHPLKEDISYLATFWPMKREQEHSVPLWVVALKGHWCALHLPLLPSLHYLQL